MLCGTARAGWQAQAGWGSRAQGAASRLPSRSLVAGGFKRQHQQPDQEHAGGQQAQGLRHGHHLYQRHDQLRMIPAQWGAMPGEKSLGSAGGAPRAAARLDTRQARQRPAWCLGVCSLWRRACAACSVHSMHSVRSVAGSHAGHAVVQLMALQARSAAAHGRRPGRQRAAQPQQTALPVGPACVPMHAGRRPCNAHVPRACIMSRSWEAVMQVRRRASAHAPRCR